MYAVSTSESILKSFPLSLKSKFQSVLKAAIYYLRCILIPDTDGFRDHFLCHKLFW